MKNLSRFLVAVACIQLASSATIPEVVQEFEALIENRIAEVGQLIGLVGRDIGQTFTEIQKNINEVTQNLRGEIDDIRIAVNSSVARAAELGRNIDECVSTATSAVSSLNLNALQSCSISNELTQVQKLIPKIASVTRQLGTLTPRCLVGLLQDAQSVRSCLENGLQQIDSSVESLNADVRSLIEAALDTSSKCVDGAREEIENAVVSIRKSLDDCVSGILNV